MGEYHLDYAYNTDTLEITDFKALQEQKEKANQPIDYTDVIVRISDTERGEYETIKITNMQSEVESALYDILSFEENEWNGNVLEREISVQCRRSFQKMKQERKHSSCMAARISTAFIS